MVRDLFRDKEANEFIIATIPTVLAIKESARLLTVLRREGIPCKRIIVNQVWSPTLHGSRIKSILRNICSQSAAPACMTHYKYGVCWQVIGPGMGEAYLKLKLGDQRRALARVAQDARLSGLRQLQSPLVDLEVRGVPALQYFGGLVWAPVLDEYAEGRSPVHEQAGAPSACLPVVRNHTCAEVCAVSVVCKSCTAPCSLRLH